MKEFYSSLERIDTLKMYDSFLETGWTTQLAIDTREILIPEIIRAITLGWASCIEQANQQIIKSHRAKVKHGEKR
jgi:hypothetical protein